MKYPHPQIEIDPTNNFVVRDGLEWMDEPTPAEVWSKRMLQQRRRKMDFSRHFAGDYLKAVDFPKGESHGQELTITAAAEEELGQGEVVVVIRFREREGGVVLNKTNFNTLREAWGPDGESWLQQQVKVWNQADVRSPTGERTGGIRLSVVENGWMGSGHPEPAQEDSSGVLCSRYQKMLGDNAQDKPKLKKLRHQFGEEYEEDRLTDAEYDVLIELYRELMGKKS